MPWLEVVSVSHFLVGRTTAAVLGQEQVRIGRVKIFVAQPSG